MADPTMEIFGVHPVEGVDCHLIEAVITGAASQPDFGQVTQPSEHLAPANWQVACGEVLLDSDGRTAVADLFLARVENWPHRARVAFFFHCLNIDRPIRTSFGDVRLPSPTDRPDRLAMLEYEAP